MLTSTLKGLILPNNIETTIETSNENLYVNLGQNDFNIC